MDKPPDNSTRRSSGDEEDDPLGNGCRGGDLSSGRRRSILAQRTATTAGLSPNGVAVVDVRSIFRASERIKNASKRLNAELEEQKAAFKRESERGNKLVEEARRHPNGSPERKKLEQEILKLDADMKFEGKKSDRLFREKETAEYFALLREVKEEIARYAQANNLQLVLGNDVPPELTDPQAVMQEISKLIVYHSVSDVTTAVAELVNRRSGAGASAGTSTRGANTPTATRPSSPGNPARGVQR